MLACSDVRYAHMCCYSTCAQYEVQKGAKYEKKSECVERRCVIIGYLLSGMHRTAFLTLGSIVSGCFEKVVVRRF